MVRMIVHCRESNDLMRTQSAQNVRLSKRVSFCPTESWSTRLSPSTLKIRRSSTIDAGALQGRGRGKGVGRHPHSPAFSATHIRDASTRKLAGGHGRRQSGGSGTLRTSTRCWPASARAQSSPKRSWKSMSRSPRQCGCWRMTRPTSAPTRGTSQVRAGLIPGSIKHSGGRPTSGARDAQLRGGVGEPEYAGIGGARG